MRVVAELAFVDAFEFHRHFCSPFAGVGALPFSGIFLPLAGRYRHLAVFPCCWRGSFASWRRFPAMSVALSLLGDVPFSLVLDK